jgi:NAD(P)-dependent dehydrogenase (short-subunit alcohol dehydrogenase family)
MKTGSAKFREGAIGIWSGPLFSETNWIHEEKISCAKYPVPVLNVDSDSRKQAVTSCNACSRQLRTAPITFLYTGRLKLLILTAEHPYTGERVLVPGLVPYSATKGAVKIFTQALSREVGSRGITVNNVQPGPITRI